MKLNKERKKNSRKQYHKYWGIQNTFFQFSEEYNFKKIEANFH